VNLEHAPGVRRGRGNVERIELDRDLVTEAKRADLVLPERLARAREPAQERLERAAGLDCDVVRRQDDGERVLVRVRPPRVGRQPGRPV
jgi:hypothetical protein